MSLRIRKWNFSPQEQSPWMWILKKQVSSKVRALGVISTLTSLMQSVVLTFLVCFAGERLKVLTCIQNNSSREVKPKYCVYRKHSFFAKGKRRVDTKDLLKEVGEPIPPSANEMVTRVITIPHDLEPSILNCSIIKVEHRLRVSTYKTRRQRCVRSFLCDCAQKDHVSC